MTAHKHAACGIFPDQGLNSCSLYWERRVLITGPPGKPRLVLNLMTDWATILRSGGVLMGETITASTLYKLLYINNNILRSLIPSLGLCALVLQTIFLWCVHNKHTSDFSDSLVLLLFLPRLNFGQFPLPYVDQVSSQLWFGCSVSG